MNMAIPVPTNRLRRFGIILALLAATLLLAANVWRLCRQIEDGCLGIDFVWRSLGLLLER